MDGFVRQVRAFDDLFGDDRVSKPVGLVYSSKANHLLTLDARRTASGDSTLNGITPFEELDSKHSRRLPSAPEDPINATFDSKFNRFLTLSRGDQLLAIASDSDTAQKRFNLRQFGIKKAEGLALDPGSNTLYVLDSRAQQIVGLKADANGNYDRAGLFRIDLGSLQTDETGESIDKQLRGIAFDANTGHLHVLSPNRKLLYEITTDGQFVTKRDLSGTDLIQPEGLTFAPSGDQTDNPNQQSLYIADSAAKSGGIVELSLAQSAIAPAANTSAQLIRTINTAAFSPSSPDPSGITYLSATNRFLISDGEVDEMPTLFTGSNLFETSFSGALQRTGGTISYTKEATGVDVNPANGHLFVSDDDQRKIFEVAPGADGLYGSADDSLVNQFSTAAFGSGDPEDVTFNTATGTLFITDGVNAEIYQTTLSGSLISQFDTASLGVLDPEGIEFNGATGNLFIIGEPINQLLEVTTSGSFVRTIALPGAPLVQPAGITLAPTSNNPSGTSIYIVDRGVDNNTDPNENDGRLFEFALDAPPPPPPPTINQIYLSDTANGTVAGIAYADEDILKFDRTTGTWSLYFDGSDVGLGGSGVDVDAFDLQSDGSILLSLNQTTTLPTLGAIADSDILRFVPTSLGANTAGTFQLYFDGSDVGFDVSGEDIDAFDVLNDGRIVFSTTGSYSVPGAAGSDEDLFIFTPSSLGDNTSGTWAPYFDGSDVGLSTTSSEDVNGVWIDQRVNPNGLFYFTTVGAFDVPGVTGDGNDIFTFSPNTLGSVTSGLYNQFWDGSSFGFTGTIDGISLA